MNLSVSCHCLILEAGGGGEAKDLGGRLDDFDAWLHFSSSIVNSLKDGRRPMTGMEGPKSGLGFLAFICLQIHLSCLSQGASYFFSERHTRYKEKGTRVPC